MQTSLVRQLHEERKARLQRIASIGKRRMEANRAKLLEVPTMEPPKAEEPKGGLPAHLQNAPVRPIQGPPW
jgi:hypothetical protein